jgi:hypothetical protein
MAAQNQQLNFLMNMNSRSILAMLLFFSALSFTACDKSSQNSGNETENNTPPDPNTIFGNFENLFKLQEMPFTLPYDYPPYGNSLAEEIKANFLPKEGNVFPAVRFPLKDGFRAFLTFEDGAGYFQVFLNVFDKNGKPVSARLVAGLAGNEVVDSEFKGGGTWKEVRRARAEDTGLPAGDGVSTNWTIDAKGQPVQN